MITCPTFFGQSTSSQRWRYLVDSFRHGQQRYLRCSCYSWPVVSPKVPTSALPNGIIMKEWFKLVNCLKVLLDESVKNNVPPPLVVFSSSNNWWSRWLFTDSLLRSCIYCKKTVCRLLFQTADDWRKFSFTWVFPPGERIGWDGGSLGRMWGRRCKRAENKWGQGKQKEAKSKMTAVFRQNNVLWKRKQTEYSPVSDLLRTVLLSLIFSFDILDNNNLCCAWELFHLIKHDIKSPFASAIAGTGTNNRKRYRLEPFSCHNFQCGTHRCSNRIFRRKPA